jgi:hypothetical protein
MEEDGISLMLKHINEFLEATPLIFNALCFLSGEL